jgi:predicted neuraminidase
VLFHSKDQRLWLYYKFGMNPSAWRGARIWSEDEGERWSKPERLPAGIYGSTRTKPLVLNDGTIVSGSSTETAQVWTAWIERSADNGNTWVKSGPITVSHQLKDAQFFAGDEPYGIIQPAIVSLGGGQLRLYARSSSQIGRICVADSFDDGRNWTVATPIGLPNPNSGIDAVCLSGLGVVLVFNNSVCKRTPLDLAIGGDGEHFRVFFRLEGQNGEYSYPALVEGQDGVLHLTYTWNRKRIRYVRIPISEIRHY